MQKTGRILAGLGLALLIHSPAVVLAQTSGSGSGANIKETYAAVAISDETRAYGYSVGHPDRETAEQKAIEACSKHASDCKVEMWTSRCVALAMSNNGAWGTDWKDSREEADKAAMAQCEKYSGTCKVKVSVCN